MFHQSLIFWISRCSIFSSFTFFHFFNLNTLTFQLFIFIFPSQFARGKRQRVFDHQQSQISKLAPTAHKRCARFEKSVLNTRTRHFLGTTCALMLFSLTASGTTAEHQHLPFQLHVSHQSQRMPRPGHADNQANDSTIAEVAKRSKMPFGSFKTTAFGGAQCYLTFKPNWRPHGKMTMTVLKVCPRTSGILKTNMSVTL